LPILKFQPLYIDEARSNTNQVINALTWSVF